MNIIDISLDKLDEAPWNANQMDQSMLNRLQESLKHYGLVQPLVVRPTQDSHFEVLSGNQRFKAIGQAGFISAPCIVVDLNAQEAMLLAQALNGIHGEDDLARKGNLLKEILAAIPQDRVLSLLPETVESLKALSSIGQQDLAQHLQAWEEAQSARLKHMQLQFNHQQIEVVEKALSQIMPKAKDAAFNNPNVRGNAIFLLCKFYLERSQE